MSQQHGVSPSLASIATTPPTNGTLSTTTTTTLSGLQSSNSPAPAGTELSSTPRSLNPTRSSSTPSTKVHIPKLSAATTELLARVTGHLKGQQQPSQVYQYQQGTYDQPLRWIPHYRHTPNHQLPSHSTGTMKASSTIIELPTAPFVYSHHMAAPSVPQTATPPHLQGSLNSSLQSASLVPIAPKPAEALSAAPSSASQIQPAPQSLYIASAATKTVTTPAPPQKKPSNTSATKSRQRKGAANGAKRSKKRRRGHDSDGEVIRAGDSSSDESDVAPTATQTKSGRQVNRPSLYVPVVSPPAAKETSNPWDASDSTQPQTAASRKRRRAVRNVKEANINCMHCQRGHSPPRNAIVFCDECNRAWHQSCHDPPIDSEVVTVKEKEWLCQQCKPVRISIVQPTVLRSNPNLQAPSFTTDPSIFPPRELPKLDIGGESLSTAARRGFLSSLSHATLVELLVTLSDDHPTVPLFPANMGSLQSSKFSSQPNILTPSPSVSANGLTGPVEMIGKLGNGHTPDALPTPSSDRRRHYDSDEESEYEIEEHRLYPRAGNGLQVSATHPKLNIVRDEPSCRTFSYALQGPVQIRGQRTSSGPVWGV